MFVKEFLDKVWGRVYWLRKKSRNKMRTLGINEIGNEVGMKRRKMGQLMATEVIDVAAFTNVMCKTQF